MFKALILIASAALIPRALAAVCSPGDLAIGLDVTGSPNAPTTRAALWDSNCNVLDFMPGDNICGSYDAGSTVICTAGPDGTPASAQLGNGLDFGDCVHAVNEECPAGGTAFFCCSPA